MSGKVIEVTTDTWEAEVINSDKPTLVDFWAPWCGPCRMLSPTLESIQADRDDIKIVKVNIDQEQAISGQFRIMNIPLIMLFKNGENIGSMLGNQPRKKIEGFLADHL